MKRNNFTKFFSAFLALAMVLSLLTPFTASANAEKAKPFKPNNHSESIMQQKAAIAEQLNLLDGGSKLHKDLQGLTGNGQVAVIVHLSEKPVALEQGIKELAGKTFTSAEATAVKKKVKTQQTAMKKEMQVKNINFTEKFAYDTVLNGFSATVQAGDLEKLLAIKGVTLIEPDTEVHAFEAPVSSGTVDANMNTSISFLGIERLWAEGIEGQGIKVAVLDTGIDKDHPDFAGIYKGGKNFIPNSATYTRTRADNDASETSPVERPAGTPEFSATGSAFYTSHGTHVAGTIAAIGANPYGVKGIAPKVDLYAYRVLGAYGSGSTSGIIAAIEESVKQKMDVINLSLGGGANSETDGGSFAINNAMMAGTISVIATGNSGPKRGTMGTPSTARLGIAVGNTTNPEANFDSNVHVTVGDYQLSKTINLMGTTFGADLTTQLSGEYEVLAVPGMGTKADYNGLDANGKVALVSRGDIAFVDKIAVAKEAGAIAILIHNFAGGSNAPNASGTFLGDAFEFIPAYDLSQTDGDAIRAALKGGQGTVTFSNFNKTMTIGDNVNDSSSRGPSTPNFDIKPDVSAPGTNIMSTIPMYKADFPAASYEEAFTRKTGTSMATPHIAGIAALVKQANPGWSAFDVKVALSNSAKILDTTKYDVMSQGAGRVQAYAAAHPTILAYAMDEAVLDTSGEIVDNIKGTVTFGPQSIKEKNISVTKDILVKDMKGNGGNYNVTVDVTKSFEDAKVTVDKSAFTLNGEQLLTVTLTASKKANAPPGSEILGYIHINGEGTEVSLPFAAEFGGAPASAFENFAITETDLSFNNDGIKDSAVLSFKLTGDVTTNYIELWDIMDPEGGEYGDGYIGYLHAGTSLAAGSYTLNVAGNYKPWTEGAAQTTIPDGLYTIDFTGQIVSGEPAILSGYVGPVVVKSEAGTIEGALKGTAATGKIIDKYIDYQAELVNYDLGYDVNTKLKASYEVMENDTVKSSGPVKLAQDGSFTIDVGTLTKDNSVKVKYVDAAGNAAEKVLVDDGTGVKYSVDKEELALQVGGTENLTVTETTTKADGTKEDKNVTAEATFVSADEKIVTVKNGAVTAVAAGKTAITVSYKEFTATIAVEVAAKDGQDQVTYSVSKTNLTIGVGQQEQLFVTQKTTKADGSVVEKDVTGTVNYDVVNSDIAKFEKGLITALAAGKTQARVMVPGQEDMYVYLEVTAAPQDQVTYSVSKKNLTIGVGQSEQFYVTQTTTKADGTVTEKDVTGNGSYNAVNNKVATVKKGLVTALAEGQTQVRVMIPNEEAIYVYVEVVKLPQDIITYKVNKTNVKMNVGDQLQLKVTETTLTPKGQTSKKDVTATTSFKVVNNKIAKVQKGLVTAITGGQTQVLVTIPDQDPILVYLNVKGDVITYSVDKNSVALKAGATEHLTVIEKTTKADGSVTKKNVTADSKFKSANSKVVTLSKGLVTAVGPGETAISISHPNFTTTVTAIVEKDVLTYSVDKNSVALKAGATEQLTVIEKTTKADGSVNEKNVTADSKFKSANSKVVTLSKGLVTAVGPGETVITVAHPNFTTTVTAIVEQDVIITTELITNPAALELVVGESSRISVQSIETKNGEATSTDVTEIAAYSGFDSTVIDVQQGQIIAVGAGETTITASYGSDVATIFVKVDMVSVPEVPEAPEVPQSPGAQKYSVSEAEIAAYVNDKQAKEIFIALPENGEEIAIEFNSTILNTIVNAKKGLVVTRGETSFFFSKKAVEKLMQQAGGDATITLSEANASSIADAISENFIVNLEGGTGDNRFALNQFNEKIEIVLPIDTSKVIKNNKIAVRDLHSTNTIKAKYNNGVLEFTATGPGSFVVINTSTANRAGNFVAISY
ncbi:S8 family serine peptidase [Sporosarcina sp. FSL K6-1540]|uniref:S8 family serine peptidase n=1 Tax=Sporosarcina sp. FSL K6-1540 TaxID=2921555 RepID=UPI00315A7CD6